jgi:NAD(P)-dependent dehydrogenase (short-subunit alcohol dehydrogenase family)
VQPHLSIQNREEAMTVTLITGATRGLGLEATRRLGALGHTVYLGARDLARGVEIGATVGATAIALDVTDEASVAAAAERIGEEAGQLDVLVNNAGIAGEQRAPAEATIADLRRVLDTNVIGAASVLSSFAPLLERSDHPVVVNVSSAVGSLARNARADATWSLIAYPVSKAALNMLTIQYARAFPRWRVNSVTPGLTATEFAPAARDGGSPEDNVEVIVRTATLGPGGPTGTFVGNDGPVPW